MIELSSYDRLLVSQLAQQYVKENWDSVQAKGLAGGLMQPRIVLDFVKDVLDDVYTLVEDEEFVDGVLSIHVYVPFAFGPLGDLPDDGPDMANELGHSGRANILKTTIAARWSEGLREVSKDSQGM